MRWSGRSWMCVDSRLKRETNRREISERQWERERDERRGRALRSLAVYGSKWQTNGTAIWQEFSLLLPTFNRPWHEHDACPSGVAATFSSSICFMARNGDTVQPLVITAASYQPGSPGSQPASCQLAGTGGRTRYKIQNCSSLVGRWRHIQEQAGNWAELGPSAGRVLPISLLTIVIATLPTFSHPTQQRRQRQFVCTLLHELSAQWGKEETILCFAMTTNQPALCTTTSEASQA